MQIDLLLSDSISLNLNSDWEGKAFLYKEVGGESFVKRFSPKLLHGPYIM